MNIIKRTPPTIITTFSQHRNISTTTVTCGSRRNFAKFRLIYRGTELEKKKQRESPDRTVPFWSWGLRHPGYFVGNRFVEIPEMIPDIIVPDLKDCPFKPYVSYRTADITQEEFGPKELFEAVYVSKIENDFINNKLNEDGSPIEPNENEKMTREEARIKARQTGSDYFCADKHKIDPNFYIYGEGEKKLSNE